MTTYLDTVIQSHLSDASIEISFNPELAKKRMQFIKFLISKYPNTDTIISKDELIDIWKCVND